MKKLTERNSKFGFKETGILVERERKFWKKECMGRESRKINKRFM